MRRASDSVTRAPRPRQQLGGGEAASRRTRDGHALVCHVESHSSPRLSFLLARAAHRSFSVVRLNNAKMIADNHEARDHFRLAPAAQLEVVMQRRHAEDALAPVALNDATWITTDSASSTNTPPTIAQQQLLLDEDGDDAERGAERQRSDVAHENLGGVRVVPKEPERGADQRAAEHRQLRRLRKMHQQQVVGEHAIAR